MNATYDLANCLDQAPLRKADLLKKSNRKPLASNSEPSEVSLSARLYWGVQELADLIGVHKNTVINWSTPGGPHAQPGFPPRVQFGGRVLLEGAALHQFFENCKLNKA